MFSLKNLLLIIFLLGTITPSLAQEGTEGSFLFGIDYQFINKNYEEPGVMTEKGNFPGIQGQIKWLPLSALNLSAQISYFAGNLNYDGASFSGTPVKQVTKDYVNDYRGLVHFKKLNFELAFGYAQRFWYNDLVISYKRKTEYTYYPVIISYNFAPFYTSLEYRVWGEGKNTSTMSIVNPAANDVNFTQDEGSGFRLEVGMIYPFGPVQAKVYIAYDKWDVEDSDIQSDGTQLLIEPENNTTTYIFGVGFIF